MSSAEYGIKQAMVPKSFVQYAITVAAEDGINIREQLQATGLDKLPDHCRYVAQRYYHYLISLVLSRYDIPAFGFRVGRLCRFNDYGVLSYALWNAETLKDSVENYIEIQDRFSKILPCVERLRESGDSAVIEASFKSHDPLVLRYQQEEFIGRWYAAFTASKEQRLLSSVSFLLPRPAYGVELEAMLGCPVRYEQHSAALELPHSLFHAPLPELSKLRNQVCGMQYERLNQRLAPTSQFVADIRKTLIKTPHQKLDPEWLADELSMSYRTLRRRLSAENTSYREVLNDVRMNLAVDYLAETGLSIKQVARILGYADSTNFYRAFKNWHKCTPSDFRRISSDRFLNEGGLWPA
jgi:AraC-like DNA-binding protein